MKTILLVEDEFLIREVAAEDLTDAGFAVTSAGDGEEALSILRDGQHFDALLTDISLPGGIDGYGIAEAARRLIPDLKVIYATGHGRENAQLGQHERLLRKPYTNADILAALREIGMLDE